MDIENRFEDILNTYGSPLYLYNENQIRENAKKYMNAFKQHNNIIIQLFVSRYMVRI